MSTWPASATPGALTALDFGQPAPTIVEMSSYFAQGGETTRGGFLPHADAGAVAAFPLGAAERALKQRMFAAHASQARVLADFPLEVERFRAAPAYDFLQPPHPGPLGYGVIDDPPVCRDRALLRGAALGDGPDRGAGGGGCDRDCGRGPHPVHGSALDAEPRETFMIATPAWPPRSTPRLFVEQELAPGVRTIDGAAAHYLAGVEPFWFSGRVRTRNVIRIAAQTRGISTADHWMTPRTAPRVLCHMTPARSTSLSVKASCSVEKVASGDRRDRRKRA